jgi:hypothetical protein
MFATTDSQQTTHVDSIALSEEATASSGLQTQPAGGSGTRVLSPPTHRTEGDFAAGIRSRQIDAGVRSDFAAGTRSAPVSLVMADFAAGQRTDRAATLPRGDFATGQRTGPAATRRPDVLPAPRRRSLLRRSTLATAKRA